MRKHLFNVTATLTCFFLGWAAPSCWSAVLAVTTEEIHDLPLPQSDHYRNGKAQAEADLRHGRLKIKTYGEPVEWDGPDLYAERLRGEYGIELQRVAGCLVTEEVEENARGYNGVIEAAIERRFGARLLERVYEQAVAEWKAQRRPE